MWPSTTQSVKACEPVCARQKERRSEHLRKRGRVNAKESREKERKRGREKEMQPSRRRGKVSAPAKENVL